MGRKAHTAPVRRQHLGRGQVSEAEPCVGRVVPGRECSLCKDPEGGANLRKPEMGLVKFF